MTLRVVKLGGRAQSDPELPGALARAWRAGPGALCVVHGGGDEVTSMQKRLGGQPAFHGGRRMTTDGDLEIVRMVLSGTVNKRLVAALVGEGVKAAGVSGEDGGLLQATVAGGGALGRVGVPQQVEAGLLRTLLDAGWLPVVSPLAREIDGAGRGLNVNGDDAAAAIAAALGAAELLLLADVPGVLVNGTPVAMLDADGAAALIADGTAAGGMAAKLEAAASALARGVPRVRIGDLSALVSDDAGTTIRSTLLTAGIR